MTKIPRKVDVLAHNILKEVDQKLVLAEPQAIPIDEIIEFHYGINLEYRYLTKNGQIHGMTVFEDSVIPVYNMKEKCYEAVAVKKGTIIIDQRLLAKNRNKRLRFTLAHELAHHILHQDIYTKKQEIASKSILESDAKEEREADDLAASLLMPYSRVKVAISRLTDKTREEKVRSLAETFCVSVQAMDIRLKTLGLY